MTEGEQESTPSGPEPTRTDASAELPENLPRTMWGQWLLRRILDAESAQMRIEAPVMTPRMRFEMRRKSFHVALAILAVPVLLFLPFVWALGLALLVMVAITVTHYVNRKKIDVDMPDIWMEVVHEPLARALESTRRPHEDFPWAPITFGIALILIGTVVEFTDVREAYAFAGFAILGIGDAASALIGVAYGRHRLQWNKGKSWEGSIAGILAGWLSAALLAGVDYSVRGEVFPPEWFGIALVGALVGAAIESIPNVQDNLFVPLGALAAMIGAGAALGLL